MMTVSYSRRNGSPCVSARSIPSVRNLTTVAGVVWSLNRTLQPTSRPHATPTSSATRRETERAATRRGCVHAMRPRTPTRAARHMFGIWVVFPEPVSPARMTTWFACIASVISSARAVIGGSGGNSNRNGKSAARRGTWLRSPLSPNREAVGRRAAHGRALGHAEGVRKLVHVGERPLDAVFPRRMRIYAEPPQRLLGRELDGVD